jgi:pSer/pThr/pTyr-binding forkhead associated (FHA) protein
MHKQDMIERREHVSAATEHSRRTVTGIEVVEYTDGHGHGEELSTVLEAQPPLAVPRRSRKAPVLDSGPARMAQLERELSQLEDEFTAMRRDADRRDREYQDRIAALLTHLNEREYELFEKDSKIASLAAAYDGLRAQVEDGSVPATGIAVGFINGHRRSGDIVESLKARLEERGRALKIAREDADALQSECARLTEALAERGQHVAQLMEQLTRGEVGHGFGMDFRSGLRRLFQRDPAVATGNEESRAWNSSVSAVETIVLDSPADLDSGDSPPDVSEAANDGKVEGKAATEKAVESAAKETTPRAKVDSVRLRRYLLPLQPNVDPVFELSGPRSYVGRGVEADVYISHPTISRLHGVLYCIGGATIVEDARSSNGVFVNRKRVQQSVLKDGDVVSFGNVAFHFRVSVSDS